MKVEINNVIKIIREEREKTFIKKENSEVDARYFWSVVHFSNKLIEILQEEQEGCDE